MSWMRSQIARRALASTPDEGEPLFPTAGKLSSQLIAAGGEPHAVHDVKDRIALVRYLIDARDQGEVSKTVRSS
jgi:hypothetical protein